MNVLEIISGIFGCVLFFGGVGFLLYVAYKDFKKSEARLERNADNLQRIADSIYVSDSHIDCIGDKDLKIIAQLIKGRSLEKMLHDYGLVFLEEYDFYSKVAERLNTYLFEADN